MPSVANEPDAMLAPTYMKVLPGKDGWGTPFEYKTDVGVAANAAPAQTYAIRSPGKDNALNATIVIGGTTNFDCDIVYSDGVFFVYPEGVQTQ